MKDTRRRLGRLEELTRSNAPTFADFWSWFRSHPVSEDLLNHMNEESEAKAYDFWHRFQKWPGPGSPPRAEQGCWSGCGVCRSPNSPPDAGSAG